METAHHSILPEALEVTECAPTPTLNNYYKRQSNDTQKLKVWQICILSRPSSISRLVLGALMAAAGTVEARLDASRPASITVAHPPPLYCVPSVNQIQVNTIHILQLFDLPARACRPTSASERTRLLLGLQ